MYNLLLFRHRGCQAAPTRVKALLLAAAMATLPLITSCTADPSSTPLVHATEEMRQNYPYFVSLSDCGGAVVAPTWVLTAAHCVEEAATASAKNYRGHSVTGAVRLHPLWNGQVTDGHDLALIQVTTAFTDGITPIQVGEPGTTTAYAAGTQAMIMGMGWTSGTSSENSGVFRVADTVIHSDDYMDDIYNPLLGRDHWRESLMIGAGDSGPGARTCQGDSGTPLVVGARVGHPVLVGVLSFGSRRCTTADAFAELNGAQLAWVASEVAMVPSAWALCTSTANHAGRMTPSYGTTIQQGPKRDGSRYWNLICVHGDAGPMQARHSGLCANVTPASAPTNARVLVQGSCGVGLYGSFERVAKPGGYFWLVVAATGQCLAIHDASTALRAKVVQADCGTDKHRLWKLIPTDNGYYEIESANSRYPQRLCLDVQGDYTTSGAFVWQFICDTGHNQQFRFPAPRPLPQPGITAFPPVNKG